LECLSFSVDMLLSAVSVLVVAQSSSEIPEGLMNNPVFIVVINQLDAQNFHFTINLFHASICFEHNVLIIKRSKLYHTASGIITLKQVSGLKLLKYNSINMSKQ